MAFNPDDQIKQRDQYAKEQDNKARKRDKNRMSQKQLEENTKPEYQMAYVSTYPDGTEVIHDVTPGATRYEMRHSSGNILQWADEGGEMKIVVGNSQTYNREGITLTVGQNGDIKITGHATLKVGGGAHIEVTGDTNLITTGDMQHYVGGNYNVVVGGTYNLQATGPINTTTGANHNLNARGNYKMESGGSSLMKSGGNMAKKAPKIDLN